MATYDSDPSREVKKEMCQSRTCDKDINNGSIQ